MIYDGAIGTGGVLECLLEREVQLSNQSSGNIQASHLEKVRSADPGRAEEEKYNNATVSLERFSR